MKKMGCAQCGGAMKMKKMQTGGSSTPVQFDMTNRELRKFRKETKKSSKEAAKGAMKKMQKGGSAEIVGMPQYGNNPRTYSGAMLKSGGSIKKMAKGGFPDLNKDGKITKADILKGRGVIKKKGGVAKAKFGSSVPVQHSPAPGRVRSASGVGTVPVGTRKKMGGSAKRK